MTKQKNIVGDLHNVHYARVGDDVHFHLGQHEFPKELTLNIPRTHQDDIIGREADLIAFVEGSDIKILNIPGFQSKNSFDVFMRYITSAAPTEPTRPKRFPRRKKTE